MLICDKVCEELHELEEVVNSEVYKTRYKMLLFSFGLVRVLENLMLD